MSTSNETGAVAFVTPNQESTMPCYLLDKLPAELRLKIYSYVFEDTMPTTRCKDFYWDYDQMKEYAKHFKAGTTLLCTCRTMLKEASPAYQNSVKSWIETLTCTFVAFQKEYDSMDPDDGDTELFGWDVDEVEDELDRLAKCLATWERIENEIA